MNCTEPKAHCIHETFIRASQTGGMGAEAEGSRVTSLVCCQCGYLDERREVLKKDPDHGPYAPKVWRPA